ncbi:MAG: (d)CMP kinase [Planctomycetes bacterium]|nr:(d)CMP kinase [Planctomycetota bacterium]
MIITIDGPAGVGKSTVAQLLAKSLGFEFLNTGAMYRCAALASLEANIPIEQADKIVEHVKTLRFEQQGAKILLSGRDVTARIRESDVTKLVSPIASIIPLRLVLIDWQKEFANGRNIVTEGRDQGSVVFTNAECKIFLTASPEIRARRRTDELIAKGQQADYTQILQDQIERDQLDANRPFGALRPAEDSVVVQSDNLPIEAVLELLLQIAHSKMP